jgi:hypothetical protein
MPVALQDNSFIIPRNSTEKIHLKNIPQKISRQKKQKQKTNAFDELPTINEKPKIIENVIDFSKYTTKKSDLGEEEPSAANNYGYLKLPELTKDDTIKLSQKKGGEKMTDYFTKFFNPRKKDDPNIKLSSSQVLSLFINLIDSLEYKQFAYIFYDEELYPTEYSYEIDGINYVFCVVFFDEMINERPSLQYLPVVENLNGMVDFNETLKQNEYIVCKCNINNDYSIKIYDNDNNEYIFDAYYKYNKPFICAEDSSDTVVISKWEPTLFLPKDKVFKTDFELSEIFTNPPKNSEFNLIKITENDKKMIKCYTHAWDFYMNDELWSNLANIDLNKIDLNSLNTGLKSEFLDDPYTDVEAESHLSDLLPNGQLVPFGLSFPISEYNMDKLAYIRKESKYKNEYYHALMNIKNNTVDINEYGTTKGVHYVKFGSLEHFKVVYRGMTRKFDLNRAGLELRNGGFVNKGFLSTSISIDVALSFATGRTGCIYEFTIMPGVPYISYDGVPFDTAYDEEDEILIGNNAIINVDGSHYRTFQGVPVIKGTINYDINYVKNMNLRHSRNLIKISQTDLDIYGLINEESNFRWEIKEISYGGKKQKKTKKLKRKTRRRMFRKNKR